MSKRVHVVLQRVVFAGLVAAGMGACAYRAVPTAVTVSPPAPATAAGSDSAAPVVQVRTYSIAPAVSVVAWQSGDPEVGIRTSLPRDGRKLPAGSRQTDHRLYISTFAIVSPGIRLATSGSEALVLSGTARETHACDGGFCLPATTHGVNIPDRLLRSTADSLVVTMVTRGEDELTVILRRDLITSYLRAIDSVAVALQLQAYRK